MNDPKISVSESMLLRLVYLPPHVGVKWCVVLANWSASFSFTFSKKSSPIPCSKSHPPSRKLARLNGDWNHLVESVRTRLDWSSQYIRAQKSFVGFANLAIPNGYIVFSLFFLLWKLFFLFLYGFIPLNIEEILSLWDLTRLKSCYVVMCDLTIVCACIFVAA